MSNNDLYKKYIKHKKKNHQTGVDKPNKSHKSFEEALHDFFSRGQVFVLGSYTRPGCEGHPKAVEKTVVRFFPCSPPDVMSDVMRHVLEHMKEANKKKKIEDVFSGVKVGIHTIPKIKDTFSFEKDSDDTIKGAVVIRAPDHEMGIAAEYQYLTEKFGQRGVNWELEGQALLEYNGRPYDELRIKLSDGNKKTVIFDLTEFFGKW